MAFVRINGILLHYRLHGPAGAPALALVNSLGTDDRIWDPLIELLAADYRILSYDKRGHGLSDLGTPPYRMDDHVDDLCRLVDHAGASEVVVCGLSVGGLIAQGLFARRPAMVRALILCDTAHRIGTAESWNQRIATVRERGLEAIADGVMKLWFSPRFHAERRAELAGCRNMLVRQAVEGYAGTCAAIRDTDHTELVRQIGVPTLCLAGDQDGSTPPALVRSMADLIPGAEFAVVEGAGHIPCVEKPRELAALIWDFLERRGARRHG